MLVVDDPDEAIATLAPHIKHQWETYRRYGVEGTDQPVPEPVDPHEWCRPESPGMPARFELFTPDQAVAALRERYTGLPVVDMCIWGSIAGMPTELAERNVELIATVVAPQVADVGVAVSPSG
jgi:hypothetical protein